MTQVEAHRLLNQAVAAGELVRPATCSVCGRACKPDGHHDDYGKPYEVRWLCQPCHNRHHRAQMKAAPKRHLDSQQRRASA